MPREGEEVPGFFQVVVEEALDFCLVPAARALKKSLVLMVEGLCLQLAVLA